MQYRDTFQEPQKPLRRSGQATAVLRSRSGAQRVAEGHHSFLNLRPRTEHTVRVRDQKSTLKVKVGERRPPRLLRTGLVISAPRTLSLHSPRPATDPACALRDAERERLRECSVPAAERPARRRVQRTTADLKLNVGRHTRRQRPSRASAPARGVHVLLPSHRRQETRATVPASGGRQPDRGWGRRGDQGEEAAARAQLLELQAPECVRPLPEYSEADPNRAEIKCVRRRGLAGGARGQADTLRAHRIGNSRARPVSVRWSFDELCRSRR